MKENNNQSNDTDIGKHSLKSIAAISILIGIICYLVVLFYQYNFEEKIANNNYPMMLNLLFNTIIINVGNILLAVGMGSILLEYFGFIEYLKKRLEDIIISDDYLNTLSTEKQKGLKERIEKNILFPNASSKDNLFYGVQNEITPLLNDYYYKEYIVWVDCAFKDDLYIVKNIKKRITISISRSGDEKPKELKDLINIHFYKIQGKADTEIFSLNKFVFGEKTFTNAELKDLVVYNDLLEEDNRGYNFSVSLKDTNLLIEEGVCIEIAYQTLTPKADCSFIHRLDKPCAHYCIHMNYDEKEIKVLAEGFGFMDSGKRGKKIKVIEKVKNGKMIRFLNWTLPGNGAIFTILEK